MSTTQALWLNQVEQQSWRSFLNSSKMIMAELERGMQQHGLSGTDYGVLVALSEAPGRRLRMSELSQGMQLEKSRLSHQITRMERAGLVRRESCPGDRRGQFACLTEVGWETIERIAPYHVSLVRAIFADRLTPAQHVALTEILGPLDANIRQNCPNPDENAQEDNCTAVDEATVRGPG